MGAMTTFRRAAACSAVALMLSISGCAAAEEPEEPTTYSIPPTTPTPSESEGDSEADESETPSPTESKTETDADSEDATAETTSLPPLEYEVPPELPDAAASHDEAGAEAFVQYAVEVLNYAQRQNDPDAVRAISDEECMFCNGVIDDLEMLKQNSWRRVGGELLFEGASTHFQEAGEFFVVAGDWVFSDFTDFESDGSVIEEYPAPAPLPGTFVVGLENETWYIYAAGVDSDD